MDINFWGLIVVPVGLTICFFPVLIEWLFGRCEGIDVEKRGKGPGA